MEAATATGKSYGEVRRLHIIYFLSQMGCVHHPHLIRVRHLNRNGVYLRDVKRWMADLRGKDMPEAFSWSYKRMYKNGYVWQDLMDDDLITPICDNEYVLKGSEILPTTPLGTRSDRKLFTLRFVNTTAGDKSKESARKDDKLVDLEEAESEDDQDTFSLKDLGQNYYNHSPTKSSSQICYESPAFSSDSSTLTDDYSMKQEQGPSKFRVIEEKADKHGNLSGNNKNKRNASHNRCDDNRKTSNDIEKMSTPSSSFSLSSSSSTRSEFMTKSKSHSRGASKILQNLITCGAVDTNDAALMAVNKNSSNDPIRNADDIGWICKGGTLGLSTRVFGTPWNQQEHRQNARRSSDGLKQQQQSGCGQAKRLPAACKPVGAPACSQCGKSFKPAKLHLHMKSCKGMKASAKTSIKRNSALSSRESMNQLMAIP